MSPADAIEAPVYVANMMIETFVQPPILLIGCAFMLSCHEYIDRSLVQMSISMGYLDHAVAIVDLGSHRCQVSKTRTTARETFRNSRSTRTVTPRTVTVIDSWTRPLDGPFD